MHIFNALVPVHHLICPVISAYTSLPLHNNWLDLRFSPKFLQFLLKYHNFFVQFLLLIGSTGHFLSVFLKFMMKNLAFISVIIHTLLKTFLIHISHYRFNILTHILPSLAQLISMHLQNTSPRIGMLQICPVLLLEVSQMVVSHPLHSPYQLLIKIVQIHRLLLVLLTHFPRIYPLKLSAQIVDQLKQVHQLIVSRVALELGIAGHRFNTFLAYFVDSKSLASRLSGTFPAVVHILIIHMNVKLCPLVRMVLIRTEVVLRLLHLHSHPRNLLLRNLNLPSGRSSGTDHGPPNVVPLLHSSLVLIDVP